MKKKILSRTIILGLILTSFYSCKEEEFYEKDFITTLSDEYEEEYDEAPGDINDIIEEVKNTCANAVSSGDLETQTIRVDFPAAIECNFNEQGTTVDDLNDDLNGPRLNGKIRARIEQYAKVTLPSDVSICDLSFNFPDQTMQYDDEIILLLNNYVVMSSQNYAENTQGYAQVGFKVNDLGFQEYKWQGDNSLYNLFYAYNVTPKYCLGLDSSDPLYNQKCFIPPTCRRHKSFLNRKLFIKLLNF